jgi:hypothetical protein
MMVFTWLAIRYKEIPLDLLKDIDDEGNAEEKPSALDFKQSDKND